MQIYLMIVPPARISRPPCRSWTTRIAVRLGAAFALLLALFAGALAVCLTSFDRIDSAERRLEAFEGLRARVDDAAIRMREQYIHQAHTLIAFDASHVDHYRVHAREARGSVAALRAATVEPEDLLLVDEMAEWVARSDQTFEAETLPAVEAGARPRALMLHASMEHSVTRFDKAAAQLKTRVDERAQAARVEVLDVHEQARDISLIIAGLSLAAAVAVGWALTRSILRRLDSLRATARRLGAGDLRARVTDQAGDEFAELSFAFDAMAESLEHHQAETVRTQKLAAMGEVLAGVAHELNNPLGVILGYVKLLRRSSERDPEALRVIEEEASLATQIVSALLDLSRTPVLKPTKVDLAALTRESATRLACMERFQALSIVIDKMPSSTELLADDVRLRQVVMNILTNAGEAAAPRGRVEVRIEPTHESVRWVVDDSGGGIDERISARVTEPFFTTKSDGLGLGLSIVHTIVMAHGGNLSFEGSPLGGTRVVVSLPRGGLS